MISKLYAVTREGTCDEYVVGLLVFRKNSEAKSALAKLPPDHSCKVVEFVRAEEAEKEITELRQAAEMACVVPADDCDCSGCSYAAEVQAAAERGRG